MRDWKLELVLRPPPPPNISLALSLRSWFVFSGSSRKISHPDPTRVKTFAVAQSVLPVSPVEIGGGTKPSCYFNPSCLPARRPVFYPNGFCLTNGVSFLQHYDPGLVVVMVNLAVGEQIPFQLLSSMMSWVWVAWKWSLIMPKMLPNGAVS
ncbi:hypothetical protein Cadr_000019512 [Camelus dromedarius]|uniref:Uncharacterized protein n=1 Tax=Camelus dromedarius TaxID=9838 RepID=A0A5N4D490_CAMDR|nr:hypothetical protein Cadr_000019512 [Camelus dromedarius]